ncbi:hypothetical protein MRX96_000549 [Rhipicephalus microplus]
MTLSPMSCVMQDILGFAMFSTAYRLRIGKLCISDMDPRMPLRHRMKPLLNDMASTTAHDSYQCSAPSHSITGHRHKMINASLRSSWARRTLRDHGSYVCILPYPGQFRPGFVLS